MPTVTWDGDGQPRGADRRDRHADADAHVDGNVDQHAYRDGDENRDLDTGSLFDADADADLHAVRAAGQKVHRRAIERRLLVLGDLAQVRVVRKETGDDVAENFGSAAPGVRSRDEPLGQGGAGLFEIYQ